MMKIKAMACVLSALLLSAPAFSELSSTVKLTSDYTFNGVSQTDNSPALQASLDYANESGLYAGTWASNLDFTPTGDKETNLEWDFYVGMFKQLNDKLSGDFGIAQYTYHGGQKSYKSNFSEIYGKFAYASNLGSSELNLWYAWDYFGTDAGHYVYQLAHAYEVAKGHTLRASFAMPTSLDKKKYAWPDKDNKNNASYKHIRLAYQTSISGFDLEAGVEDTSLGKKTSDARVVVSVARTFGF